MSSVLDENVVILRFDNSDFEKNTKQSMETLDKLKSSVNKNTGESLTGLEKSANKINLSGLGKAIDTVNSRFSLFGIAGMATINRLTNSAITATKNIITAIPKQAIQGGWQRALNIEQAKNLIDGLGYAWDETSEKYKEGMKTVKTAVDNAVTGTRYSLDEAALVASQLLSSGVEDTEKLEFSLKSISGLASVLNADYGDIGRIFAQVAGQGRMMGDDLLQLQQRGIGAADYIARYLSQNKEVAKAALDSAIAQGKQVKKMEEIKEHAKITGADVREMVSAGAINFDILSSSFNELFDQAEKANDTYTGSLANLKSAINRIGESFMKIKLESFTKLFNALIPIVKRFKELLDPLAERVSKTAESFTKFIVNGVINPFGEAIGAKNLFTKLGYAAKDTADKVTDANKDIQDSAKKTDKEILGLNKEYKAARDIWYKGTYGNGSNRKNALEKLGISYKDTQAIINQFYKEGFKWDNIEKQLIKDYNDKAKAQEDSADATNKAGEATENQTKKYPAIISLLKGFVNIVTSVKLVLGGVKNIIVEFGRYLKAMLTPGLKRGVVGFESLTESILKAAKKFNEFSKTFKEDWLRGAEKHPIFFQVWWGLIKIIGAAKDTLIGLVTGLKEFFTQFSESEGFELLKEQLASLMEVVKDLAGGALNKVTDQLGKLSEIGASSNMSKIVGFFSNLAGELANMIAAIRRGENPLKGFTSIFGKVKDALSFKSLAKHGVSGGVNALSAKNGTVAMVVNATESIKKANIPKTFNTASESIFNFFDGLSSKVKGIDVKGTLNKVLETFKNADWESISKIAFRIGSLAAIFKTVHDMSRMVDAAVGTLGSISGFFGSLSGLVKAETGAIKARNFEMIALSVAILIGSIVALAAVPTDRLIPAMSGVLILVGMLVGVMTLMTSSKFEAAKVTAVGTSFAAMGASLLLLAMACKLLASINGEGLLKAGTAITIFMGLFILAGRMKGQIMASGAAFLAMAGAVNLLVFAVGAFAIMPWSAILKGATAVGLIMTELVIAARIAGTANPAGLLAMAVALDLLIPAIVVFSMMPAEQAMKGAVIACTILAMIGVASRTATSGGAKASMVTMSVTIATLAAAMVVLSMIDSDRLATAALALSATMMSLAVAADVAKSAKGGLALMSVAIATIAASIIALIKIDAQAAINVANSLSILAASLGVAIGIFSMIGAQGALMGLAGLGIAIGGITAIIMALGAIKQIPGAEWLLGEGKKFAEKLGEAIGGFVGSIVSGFGKAATSGLPQMGTNLAEFAENIQPFIAMAKTIDADTAQGVKDLSKAIMEIAKADFVEGLSLFTGVDDLAQKMSDLGEGFVEFSNTVDSIPDDTAEKAGKIAKIISTLATSFGEIPKSNGVAQAFTGWVDIDLFVDGLLDVAKALGKNGMSAGLADLEIPDDLLGENGKITKIAEVIKTMASAVKKIPKTGGLQQGLTGFHDISGMADGIISFANALGSDQEGLTSLANIEIPDGLVAENGPITKICQVIAAMSEAANLIPESMGAKQLFLGNTTINEFAAQLADAVPGLETFINAVGEKDLKFGEKIKEKVVRIAEAVGAMATASQQIPETDGFKQIVFGGSDISDFAIKLAEAIPGLQTFAEGVGQLKIGKAVMAKIPNITDAITAMAGCAKALPKSDGVWQRLTGQKDIGKFGGQLKTLINSLDGITAKNINTSAINDAANGLNAIIPAVQKFKGVTPVPTGSNLPKLARNAASFVESLGSVDTKGLASKAAAISTAATKLNTKAVQGINSAAKSSNVSSAGSGIASSFLSGIQGKMSTATSAGKSLSNKVKSGAGSISLSSVGKSVGAGFVSGINAKQSAAYRAGSALGYKAKQGAKNAVDSHSPAKEFIKLGKYSGEGLVIGLKSYEQKVYKAGYETGDSSLRGARDGLGDFLADNPNPVITPVMDLSEVDRGLATLNNDFSRNRTFGIDSTFQANDWKTNKMMNDMVNALNKMESNQTPGTNYFTFNVDGAENPEEFAQRFVRQVQLEMRTG